jgi:hypothetical protein
MLKSFIITRSSAIALLLCHFEEKILHERMAGASLLIDPILPNIEDLLLSFYHAVCYNTVIK